MIKLIMETSKPYEMFTFLDIILIHFKTQQTNVLCSVILYHFRSCIIIIKHDYCVPDIEIFTLLFHFLVVNSLYQRTRSLVDIFYV